MHDESSIFQGVSFHVLTTLRTKLLAVFLGMSILALLAFATVLYHNTVLARSASERVDAAREQFELEFYLASIQRLSYGLFALAAGEEAHGRSVLQDARRSLDRFEATVSSEHWNDAVLPRSELAFAFAMRAELDQHIYEAEPLIEALRGLPADRDSHERSQLQQRVHVALTRAVSLADRADLFIAHTFEELRENERRRTAEGDALAERVNIVTILLSAAVLLVAVLASLLLARSLVRRLTVLGQTAMRLGKGDLSARSPIRTSRTRDELDQLTESFNRMAADLEENTASREVAESATRAKSVFLASMSHELRTPLNSILGFSQFLLTDETLSSKQRDALETMQASGEHLLTLLDDVLDISRIEAGRLELKNEEFSLPNLLASISAMFRENARQKKLQFLYEELSDIPQVVVGDARRLRQVLINLLGNAVKYTDTGGVVLRVGVHNGAYRFQVEDTGIGMPESELDGIFEPFRQVSDGERRTGGVGLGLAISRRLVKMMGGTMDVTSEVGKGSKFWVDIPLDEVAGKDMERAVERRIVGYRGARKSVLIVDDREENRAVLRSLLGSLGFELREAKNGREAVDAAVWKTPDLILMDMRMPEMDGLEATRKLRQIEATRRATIVAVSASAFDDDREACMAAGCDGFLSKPVRFDRVTELLARLLGLEWLYRDVRVPEELADEVSSGSVTVPDEMLTRLTDLARRGDIKGLRLEAENLPDRDPALRVVAEEILELAKGYRIKQIRELLAGLARTKD